MTLIEAIERSEARKRNGAWVAACGGTERPFVTKCGRTLLYVWQASSGRHAYLDVTTDIILSDDEAQVILG